jgi:hypothetical protein
LGAASPPPSDRSAKGAGGGLAYARFAALEASHWSVPTPACISNQLQHPVHPFPHARANQSPSPFFVGTLMSAAGVRPCRHCWVEHSPQVLGLTTTLKTALVLTPFISRYQASIDGCLRSGLLGATQRCGNLSHVAYMWMQMTHSPLLLP